MVANIPEDLKVQLVNAVQDGTAKFVTRLSKRRSVFYVDRNGKKMAFVYNRAEKTIELYRGNKARLEFNQRVWWRTSEGFIRTGVILCEVAPNVSPVSLTGKWPNAKSDHLASLDTRGQPSYLVMCKTNQGDKIEWPQRRTLRSTPVHNRTKDGKRTGKRDKPRREYGGNRRSR